MMCRLCVLSLLCLTSLSFFASSYAKTIDEALRYAPTEDATYAYDVVLEIDGVDGERTLKGQVTYQATKVNDEQVSLSYSGGISQSSARIRSRSRGYPRFETTNYGRAQVRFSISPTGEVQSMDDETQLPYLLGNLANLPFERLPENTADAWEFTDKTAIRSAKETSRFPGPSSLAFRSRFFGEREKEETTAATEIVKYKVKSVTEQLVTVSSDYELKSAPDVSGRKIEVDGNGEWSFNRGDRMPESLDLTRTITVINDKVTIRIPIKLSLKRVSQEEIARRTAEAKKRREKADRERKAPLTDEERAEILATLKSGDRAKIHRALVKLMTKTPEKPDAEISAAVKNLDSGELRALQHLADRVLVAWSPNSAREKINADYRGHGTVPSTGRKVEKSTVLYKGQIIQYRFNDRSSFWKPGIVREILGNGKVLIAQNEPFNRVKEVDLHNIQLAPDEVEQPARDQSLASNTKQETGKQSKFRVWTDATGTHETEAQLLEFANGNAKLRRKDGKVVSVPADKLSQADQAFLQEIAKKNTAAKVPNPFDP